MALTSSFLNFLRTRVDNKTYQNFTTSIKMIWNDIEIPFFLNMPNEMSNFSL
jgi:hypothetical protein